MSHLRVKVLMICLAEFRWTPSVVTSATKVPALRLTIAMVRGSSLRRNAPPTPGVRTRAPLRPDRVGEPSEHFSWFANGSADRLLTQIEHARPRCDCVAAQLRFGSDDLVGHLRVKVLMIWLVGFRWTPSVKVLMI